MTRAVAIAVLIVTALGIAGFFGYQEYEKRQVVAQIRPAVKNASIRISQTLELDLRPGNITYREFFEKTESSIAELDKKTIDLRSLDAGPAAAQVNAAAAYLASGQELLRAHLQESRAKLAAESAQRYSERTYEEAKGDRGYGREYLARAALKAVDEAIKAATEYMQKVNASVAATRAFAEVLDTTSAVLPTDMLVDRKLVQEVIESREPTEKKKEESESESKPTAAAKK